MPPPVGGVWRAIDVGAPAGVVFRWLCRLKVAPEGYDLLATRAGAARGG